MRIEETLLVTFDDGSTCTVDPALKQLIAELYDDSCMSARKIAAIRYVRAVKALGLKETKDLCDAIGARGVARF